MKRFRVYRHTVPAFISLSKLESVYLPFPGTSQKARGDGEGESDSEAEDGEVLKPRKGERTRKQDLRGFVRELRRELVAWHLRSDAVDLLRERLGLGETEQSSPSESENGTGIVSLASTAIETRYVRLEWEDGRVGRFKLSNAGIVERAVVIGDKGRDQRTEEAMTGGGGRVETLLERLRKRGSSAA